MDHGCPLAPPRHAYESTEVLRAIDAYRARHGYGPSVPAVPGDDREGLYADGALLAGGVAERGVIQRELGVARSVRVVGSGTLPGRTGLLAEMAQAAKTPRLMTAAEPAVTMQGIGLPLCPGAMASRRDKLAHIPDSRVRRSR